MKEVEELPDSPIRADPSSKKLEIESMVQKEREFQKDRAQVKKDVEEHKAQLLQEHFKKLQDMKDNLPEKFQRVSELTSRLSHKLTNGALSNEDVELLSQDFELTRDGLNE